MATADPPPPTEPAGIYGLLLAPDTQDALDSGLALTAYNDIASYRALANPQGEALTKTRADWKRELEGEDE